MVNKLWRSRYKYNYNPLCNEEVYYADVLTATTCLCSCKSYLRQRMTTYKPEEEVKILSNTTKLFCVLPLFGNLDSTLRQ